MKVLVCGGRFYNNWRHVYGLLDVIQATHGEITCIVTGACSDEEGNPRGADWWAEKWARTRGVRYVGYPAKFKKYGKPAGPMRNQAMFDEQNPSIVVALPGNKGTGNMIGVAEKAGLERRGKNLHDGTVILYRYDVPGPAPMTLDDLRGKAAASE